MGSYLSSKFGMSYTLTPELMTAAKDKIEKLIPEYTIVIFSKTYCPYCRRAKQMIASLGLGPDEVKILELDDMGEEGAAIQEYLLQKTGQRTVPNIFVKGKHLGGCDDLLAAERSGKLQQMLSS